MVACIAFLLARHPYLQRTGRSGARDECARCRHRRLGLPWAPGKNRPACVMAAQVIAPLLPDTGRRDREDRTWQRCRQRTTARYRTRGACQPAAATHYAANSAHHRMCHAAIAAGTCFHMARIGRATRGTWPARDTWRLPRATPRCGEWAPRPAPLGARRPVCTAVTPQACSLYDARAAKNIAATLVL